MAYNTTINQVTGKTPFKLTFRRDANLHFMLDRIPNTKYQDLLTDCTRRHEYYLNKTKKRLEITKLKK